MTDIEKIAGLLVALSAVIAPIVTLILGKMQARNQQNKDQIQARLDGDRGLADDLLDFTVAAKNMGENWQQIIVNLRDDIIRIKADSAERETDYLARLDILKAKLQDTQNNLERVMENDMERTNELEAKLQEEKRKNENFQAQIVQVQSENIRLQTELNETRDEVNKLRLENHKLRETIRVIQRDVRGIKKQTGELRKGHE